MSHLRESLAYYRRKLHEARDAGDIRRARIFSIMVTQMLADVEVEPDTPEQEKDFLLGWVRMRQLELDHAEELLRDNRPAGVEMVARFVEEMGERFEAAMNWEKKEKQAS